MPRGIRSIGIIVTETIPPMSKIKLNEGNNLNKFLVYFNQLKNITSYSLLSILKNLRHRKG